MAKDLTGKTVRLPPDLWDALAKQAKTMDRSVNYVIIQAIKDHVMKVVPDVSKLVSSQYQNGTRVVLSTPSPAQARTVPEKKEEKSKKKKGEAGLAPLSVSKEVIGYLNELIGSGSKQEHTAKSHRTLIQARLSAGATVDDLKTVIRKKCEEWLGTPMQSNLRPSCLFRASNFDGYLGQPDAVKQSYGKKNHVQRMTEAQDQGEWSWEGVE